MAGFTIHLAVGEEYLRNHKEDKIERKKFLEGIVAPDLTNIKYTTHHGLNDYNSDKGELNEFCKKHDIKDSYWLGYFIHLATDYYFYSVYFGNQIKNSKNGNVYNDYDCLNEMIIKKYNVELLDNVPEIKQSMKNRKGVPEVLKENLICDFIETMGKMIISSNGNVEINK